MRQFNIHFSSAWLILSNIVNRCFTEISAVNPITWPCYHNEGKYQKILIQFEIQHVCVESYFYFDSITCWTLAFLSSCHFNEMLTLAYLWRLRCLWWKVILKFQSNLTLSLTMLHKAICFVDIALDKKPHPQKWPLRGCRRSDFTTKGFSILFNKDPLST